MRKESFNSLGPAEAERLAMLVEECGEVIQAAGKILRHGYDSEHPETGVSNLEALERELSDVLAVMSLMAAAYDINEGSVNDNLQGSIERRMKYAHHQDGLFT